MGHWEWRDKFESSEQEIWDVVFPEGPVLEKDGGSEFMVVPFSRIYLGDLLSKKTSNCGL